MKYNIWTTVLWLVILSIPASAQENLETPAADSSQVSAPDVADNVSVNAIAPDDAIQTRLTEILKATKWFEDIHVEVRDSVAFLDGTTPDDQRKEWAGQLAHNTEGVAAVVNRLTVNKAIDVSQALKVVANSVKGLWKDFLARSPLLIAGLLTLVLTAVISKVTGSLGTRLAQRSHIRSSLQDLILQLVSIAVWVVGLLLAAVIVFPGMTPSKALTVLGLGSVAIGFAFKDIFENFFAGILILWKYPFDRGDFVSAEGVEGRIEEITIRMTMIRQVDGQLVVVPNSLLFKNPVDVLTSRPSRRITVICGVAYDTDLEHAREVLQESIENCPSVRKELSVEILAQEFADSSINFELTWWTGSKPLDIRQSRDEVVRAVKRALDKAGIEIPFPQRTLWLPEPMRIQDARGTANESTLKNDIDSPRPQN